MRALHLMIEAKKLAYADMVIDADPKFAKIPVDGMKSKAYAKERAKLIDLAACDVDPGVLDGYTNGGGDDTIYLTTIDKDRQHRVAHLECVHRRVLAVGRDVDDLETRGPADHVVVRQDFARAGDDHPGARRDAVLVAERGVDVDDAGVRPRLHPRVQGVPGGAGRRGGYGRGQRRQDGEQEASHQSGHVSIRASIE